MATDVVNPHARDAQSDSSHPWAAPGVSELLAAGRAEVESYGGRVAGGTGESAESLGHRAGFRVSVKDEDRLRTLTARRLLVTTGLVDEPPPLPGLAEQWGRGVLHCPYCHGWEVRDQPVGILSTSAMGAHAALLWRQWTDDVTLFVHTGPAPDHDQRERLAARGIRVTEEEVAAVEENHGELTGLRLASGEVVERSAVVVAARFTASAEVLVSLGLEPVELLLGDYVMGTYVPADPSGATTVPGVWVAGNVADLRAQVIVLPLPG